MYPQFKDYNEVKVTLFFKESYVVSNIHKTYSSNDNAHLQSLSVAVPSAGDKSKAGCTGTLSLVDYKNELFTKFITYQTENKGESVQIPLKISISCFSRKVDYEGVIDKWTLSFNGAVPTIEVEWKQFPIFKSSAELNGTYVNPSGFIDAAVDLLKHNNMPKKVVYVDSNGSTHEQSEFDNLFEFLYPDNIGYVLFNAQQYKSGIATRGTIYAALEFFMEKVKLKSDSDPDNPTKLTYAYNYSTQTFEIRNWVGNNKSVSNKSDDNSITDFVFVLNGSKPAYSTPKEFGGKCVIPMTSFSFSVDQSNAILMYSINANPNGTIATKAGGGVVATNASSKGASSAIYDNANDSGDIQISFDCYNVMSFDVNNPKIKINIRIFTEFGEEHPITRVEMNRFATVQSVSYDLSGAVIKASVKATLVFNSDNKEVTKNDDQEDAAIETASGDNKDETNNTQAEPTGSTSSGQSVS